MGDEQPNGDDDWQRQIDDLRDRVDLGRADIDALQSGAAAASTRADAADARADAADTRADAADQRADAHEARSERDTARIERLEGRAEVDQALIAELQADGVVSARHAAHLEEALRSSRRIGAAIGIVMAQRAVDEAEAFLVLVNASQNANRKLRTIADEVVENGDVSSLPGA